MSGTIKASKSDLIALFKANNIGNYSKLNKDGMIEKLKEHNIDLSQFIQEDKKSKSKSRSNEENKESPKRPVKFEKGLNDSIDLEKYNAVFAEHKEAPSKQELYALVKNELYEFVDRCELADLQQTVDKFGILYVINYQRQCPKAKLSKQPDADIYKILLKHRLDSDQSMLEPLYQKAVKHYTKLHKPPVEKKAKAPAKSKKVKRVSGPDEDADEEDIRTLESHQEEIAELSELSDLEEEPAFDDSGNEDDN